MERTAKNGIKIMKPLKTLPAKYVGLWERVSKEDASGQVNDTKTNQIYWLQSKSLYIDIRVPVARPSFEDKNSLSEYNNADLHCLAQQQGFAGTAEVNKDICTWIRHIDYQPPRDKPDIGRMDFKETVLHEYGVHTYYKEVWQRRETTGKQLLGLELLNDGKAKKIGHPRRGYLIAVDDYFMFASDRTRKITPAASLIDLIDEKGYSWDELIDILNFEISFGIRFSGKVPWEIRLSTLPFREGKSLLIPDQISSLQPPNQAGEEIVIASLDSQNNRVSGRWVVRDWTAGFIWFKDS